VLLFAGQRAAEDGVAAPLDEALDERVEDVDALLHQFDVGRTAVDALAVLDRPLEHVAELGARPQKVGPHEIHHAPAAANNHGNNSNNSNNINHNINYDKKKIEKIPDNLDLQQLRTCCDLLP